MLGECLASLELRGWLPHERLEVIGAGLGGMQTMISFKKAGRKVASSVFPWPVANMLASNALRT